MGLGITKCDIRSCLFSCVFNRNVIIVIIINLSFIEGRFLLTKVEGMYARDSNKGLS